VSSKLVSFGDHTDRLSDNSSGQERLIDELDRDSATTAKAIALSRVCAALEKVRQSCRECREVFKHILLTKGNKREVVCLLTKGAVAGKIHHQTVDSWLKLSEEQKKALIGSTSVNSKNSSKSSE